FLKYDTDNKFTPPSEEGSLLFGYSGGAEWGGNAIDSDGILYQNSNDNPWILQMIDSTSRNREFASLSYGNALYAKNCASCHGPDRKGSGTEFPDITRIGERFTKEQVADIIKTGSGRMPSFRHLSQKERDGIVNFLFDPSSGRSKKVIGEHGDQMVKTTHKNFGFEPAYLIKVWSKFSDQDGYPGIKPPWGTLNAIDLNTGEYLWRVPLGEYPELTEKGIPITGTESYGGPLVTAGGLVFIAGTKDERIRAFDKKTGKVVWEYQLPAGGFATPITYEVDGKQFLAIAAGGERGQKPGGNYIAFALSE
ncbi:MAG TPA: c-type cytochrome, partial [Pricia sp.]|nr:c-type cytochrome [Pricia sp.]